MDNTKDMIKKGRKRIGYKSKLEHWMAKITPDMSNQILDMSKNGIGYSKISKLLNIGKTSVSRVVNGTHWTVSG